jgi:hypothetical protein
MSKPWTVVPMGGLANRIRSILSWRSSHGPIEVLWARSTGVCRARFLDVLEPLEGVTFGDIGDGPAQDYKGPCDVAPTCSLAPDAKPGWTESYMELRPLPPIQARIDAIKKTIGSPYYAIHARRTDHVTHAARFGHFTTNDELAKWIGIRRMLPLYVATDCPDTLHWFRQRFDTRCNVEPKAVDGYDKRAQSLEDAVIDLWMCVGAREFRGSWFSSFSETIDVLRCGGRYPGGFDPHTHMPSQDASYEGKTW